MKGTKPQLRQDRDAVDSILPPPDWMSDNASTEWVRVQPILVERRILTVADLGSLENYCLAIGQVREAERHLQQHGHVVDVDGVFKRNPASLVLKDGIAASRQLAAELGLTPVSRSRPAIRDDEDADSLLD